MYNQINAYSVELYIGEKRSGKTLSMTADTYNDIKVYNVPDIKIYTNYWLNPKYFKNVEPITLQALEKYHKHKVEFRNSIFLIDEFQKWFDSRNHATDNNKQIGYFMGQMGKRGNVLRGTVHDMGLIDLRGRLYAELEIYVFKGTVNEKGRWEQLENYNIKVDYNILYIQLNERVKKLVKTRNILPEFRHKAYEPRYIKAKDFFDMYKTEELM